MNFYNVKVGDKLTWVTQGTTWLSGKPHKRLLKYPAEVVEVFENTFICKTTDVYYLYKCNKSNGVAVGYGHECGWAEKVNFYSSTKVKSSFKRTKKKMCAAA